MPLFHWSSLKHASQAIWRATTAVLLLAALAQPGVTPVQAAPAPRPLSNGCSVVVSTTADAGAGSLRDAVTCANGHNINDTVTFDAGLAGATITLTSEIEIQVGLTIDGSGAAGVMVDAGNNSRIFFVNTSAPVTLTALIVQHGSEVQGGAVYSFAEPLTLSGVAVLSSTATTTAGGGGVRAFGALNLIGGRFEANACSVTGCVGGGLRANSTVVLSGTTFISNTSYFYGAGADFIGAATLTNGHFENNQCSDSNCTGGGLRAGVAVTMTNTSFISNTSNSHGAGAYVVGDATLTGGVFERNACGPANCNGGGLYAESTLTLTGTQFLSNTSRYDGGGLYENNSVTVTLTNALFQGNSCDSGSCYGGGLSTYGSLLVMTNTDFISNTSLYYGGGVYAYEAATLNGGRFQGNACTESTCSGGGLTTDGLLTLTGTEFISNTSLGNGGGAYADAGAALTNGLFSGNTCTEAACRGGGVYVNSSVALTGTEFYSNGSIDHGGGVYTVGGATLAGGRFEQNACTGTSCGGGGLYVNDSLTVTGTQFLSNTSQYSGGAVEVLGAAALTNSHFQGSACVESACSGGGLHSNSSLTLTGTQFLSNTSQGSGGGAFAGAAAVLTGGQFAGNACAGSGCQGGGLAANTTLVAMGTDFLNNSADMNGGGAYAAEIVTLTNGLWQGNSCLQALCEGGGLNAYSTLVVTNTQFLTNTSGTYGGGVRATGAVTLTGSRLAGNACVASGCQGGGLYLQGELTASNTDFISNTSQADGGGVYAASGVTLTGGQFARNTCLEKTCNGGGLNIAGALAVTATEFISNTSGNSGGAAFVQDLTTATNAIFAANACLTRDCTAGGLFSGGGVLLTGTEFLGNRSQGNGAALSANNTVTVIDGRFEGNTCVPVALEVQAPPGHGPSPCSGSAVYVDDGTAIVTNSVFFTNTSTSDGGAIYVFGEVSVNHSQFQGNACTLADCRGGAVGVSKTAVVTSTTFSGNEAAGVGGAVAGWRTASVTLANVTLSGNTAGQAGGGLYAGDTSQAYLLNVTIANNQAAIGGGLYTEVLTKVGITNTVLANNGPSSCGGQIDFGTHNLEWPGTSCALAGPAAGFTSANALLGPLALNAPGTTWTHALLADSPARDTGEAAACAGPWVNNLDQRGVVRPIDGDAVAGAVCDIGAYEAPIFAITEWVVYLPVVVR